MRRIWITTTQHLEKNYECPSKTTQRVNPGCGQALWMEDLQHMTAQEVCVILGMAIVVIMIAQAFKR